MRVTITTAGSRGDLQPYIALGRGLMARGHIVTLASHRPYESFVRAHGLAFRGLVGNPQEMLAGEGGQAWLETGSDPLSFLLHCAKLATPMIEEMMADLQSAVTDADAVIYGPLTYPAYDCAEALGVPAMMAGPVPLSATGEFPFPVMPEWLSLGGPLNYLGHQAILHFASLGFMSSLNRWRHKMGLRPLLLGGLSFMRQQEMSALYGISRHLLPRPADWGPNIHITGTWFLDDEHWQPPARLLAFLADGPAPVYVGFGSMAGRDPIRLAETVFEALRLAGRRGIVLSGWAGLGRGEVPDHVLMVDDVPHSWLFPRVAAVVHHGGAGTTAAGLRAGVPSIVAPYFADQPFWAARVQNLGVGPRPIHQSQLTASALGAAISVAVTDPGMRERAATLGALIRAEDGVGVACDVFERFVAQRKA